MPKRPELSSSLETADLQRQLEEAWEIRHPHTEMKLTEAEVQLI